MEGWAGPLMESRLDLVHKICPPAMLAGPLINMEALAPPVQTLTTNTLPNGPSSRGPNAPREMASDETLDLCLRPDTKGMVARRIPDTKKVLGNDGPNNFLGPGWICPAPKIGSQSKKKLCDDLSNHGASQQHVLPAYIGE